MTLDELKGYDGFSYLGSPYSKHPAGPDEAARQVAVAAALLMQRGHRIFCPIAHSHAVCRAGQIDHLNWEFWRTQDEPLMRAANGLIVLKLVSWEESTGLADEIAVFEWLRKPIVYVEPEELEP